ncbi:hypothetical protein MHYP_G00019910 [Metynnis hypsauchen]
MLILVWRDKQLERQFRTLTPLASTPILPTPSVVYTSGDHRQSQLTITSNSLSTVPIKPPIKLEFPRYGGYVEEQDPLVFIEKCEEFLAVRPLGDLKVLAAVTEKDLLQAIMRNCNPRLASILRGTFKTVDELVRVGTLVEQDLSAIRGYWSQAHTDKRGSKFSASKGNRKGPAQNSAHSSALQPKVLCGPPSPQ